MTADALPASDPVAPPRLVIAPEPVGDDEGLTFDTRVVLFDGNSSGGSLGTGTPFFSIVEVYVGAGGFSYAPLTPVGGTFAELRQAVDDLQIALGKPVLIANPDGTLREE